MARDGPTALMPGLLATVALLSAGLAPTGFRPGVVRAFRDDGRNLADTEQMERGYYEEILDAGRRLDDLSALAFSKRGAGHDEPEAFQAGQLDQVVDDLREFVLRPNVRATLRRGRWTTNARGMRDREYPLEKPPGTVRIGLMGDSIAAGWGVDDGQAFESVVEAGLNARWQERGGEAVEIWNFAVPGHAPGQRWEHFQREGWASRPDLVIYEATPADPGWDEHRLRGLLPRGLGWKAPQYRTALEQSGARPGGTFDLYKQVLSRYRWAILENVYRAIEAGCRSRGVPVVWVLIPRVGAPGDEEDRGRLVSLARKVGFDRVLDLSDVYEGLDPKELAIAADDYHPNARGHALLAARLQAALAGEVDRISSSRPSTRGPDAAVRAGARP